MTTQSNTHYACRYQTDKTWLDRQYHKNGLILKPDELAKIMIDPPTYEADNDLLDRVQGSMFGMALGDALGASVEFRPRQYLVEHPFTDDTSMALCLANSLITRQDFVPYDQLVRYKWWYKDGYMSSTGKCFDIGSATKNSINEFERRQHEFSKNHNIPFEQIDYLTDQSFLTEFDVYCSSKGVAGNGALMRLAPVPLFFHRNPLEAVAFSGFSGVISHGDRIAFDACRYYGALIVAAIHGLNKDELLDKNFFFKYERLFNNIPLHPNIMKIAQGSYKGKNGYDQGIRGKGYIVDALEAALWAFYFHDTFEKGVLAAVNLGDDTDTTAAIYGQLAGAYYGYKNLPEKWLKDLYAPKFIECVSKWLICEGEQWRPEGIYPSTFPSLNPQLQLNQTKNSSIENKRNINEQSTLIQTDNISPKAKLFSKMWSTKSDLHPISSTHKLHSIKETEQISHTNTTEPPLFNSHGPGHSDQQSNNSSRHLSHDRMSLYCSMPHHFRERLQSCDDVSSCLISLGDDYKNYAKAFKDDFVDGFWLLNYINDENLQNKYQIQNELHRKNILKKIQQFKSSINVN
ncbi:unnamed protein product, partial [Adineta steineri]